MSEQGLSRLSAPLSMHDFAFAVQPLNDEEDTVRGAYTPLLIQLE